MEEGEQEGGRGSRRRGQRRRHLLDSLHHDNLELIRDLGHEGRDLLHEAVNAALTARLTNTTQHNTTHQLDRTAVKHIITEAAVACPAQFNLDKRPKC